jgi:uncharacterized protein (UPF0335 family)
MAGNGYDAEVVGGIIQRWERLEAEFASERGRLMANLKDDKETLLDEADANGIAPKLLRAELKRRKKARELNAIGANFDADDEHKFAMLQAAAEKALGPLLTTPLGQAHLAELV